MKPAGNGCRFPNGPSLAGQDQERGLHGIFNLLLIAENVSTDALDHMAMPGHQRCESSLIAMGDKLGKQFCVGLLLDPRSGRRPA